MNNLQDFNMVKIESRPQTELNRINCDTSEIMSMIEQSFILVAKAIVVRKIPWPEGRMGSIPILGTKLRHFWRSFFVLARFL